MVKPWLASAAVTQPKIAIPNSASADASAHVAQFKSCPALKNVGCKNVQPSNDSRETAIPVLK